MSDIHTSAQALIIKAAEKSGLLREVAELLWFANKHRHPSGRCAVCELLDQLTEAFDDHTAMAGAAAENIYGEGLAIWPSPDEEHEAEAFLGPKGKE
jgi:hypothetical protein